MFVFMFHHDRSPSFNFLSFPRFYGGGGGSIVVGMRYITISFLQDLHSFILYALTYSRYTFLFIKARNLLSSTGIIYY